MEVDVEKTSKPDVLERVPFFDRVTKKTLLDDTKLAAKCSELRLAATKLVQQQNAAATQSQSKRKAEVAGDTTDNNDSYLKKAKSAQRIPKKSPPLVNTISRNDSPYFIGGRIRGPPSS